jgi:acyl dehydratase
MVPDLARFLGRAVAKAVVAQAVTDWAGVGRVRKITVRFAALVRLGDVITCRGKRLEKRPAKTAGDQDVDLELWAENQKGEKVVTGRATVTLASRG